MSQTLTADGVHSLLPRNLMTESARRRRDAYAITPGAPFQKLEFGFYCIDEWRQQGLPANANFDQLFSYDPPGNYSLGGLGWCEAAMVPAFEVKLIEQRGDTEIEQDFAGRHVLYFKGRRNGFMPEYVDHPVKDLATWRNNIKWRLNPQDPARFVDLDSQMARAKEAAANGLMITQGLVGSFMYLRSMIGPEELLYAFHDQPELIDECMKTWYELADAVIARHQQHVTLDEIFFAEDNCYNHGPLVDPAMLRSMLRQSPFFAEILIHSTGCIHQHIFYFSFRVIHFDGGTYFFVASVTRKRGFPNIPFNVIVWPKQEATASQFFYVFRQLNIADVENASFDRR